MANIAKLPRYLDFVWITLLSITLHALFLLLPIQKYTPQFVREVSLNLSIQTNRTDPDNPKLLTSPTLEKVINNSTPSPVKNIQKQQQSIGSRKSIASEKNKAAQEPGLYFRALESVRSESFDDKEVFLRTPDNKGSIIMKNMTDPLPITDNEPVKVYRSLSGVNEVRLNGQCFEFDDIDPLDDQNIGGAYWRHKRCPD